MQPPCLFLPETAGRRSADRSLVRDAAPAGGDRPRTTDEEQVISVARESSKRASGKGARRPAATPGARLPLDEMQQRVANGVLQAGPEDRELTERKRRQIVDGAARLRIPAIYARQEYAEAGGLISYGSDSYVLFARAADYVSRILRGTPPAELPFEMASTFRLVLNLRTSRELGLVIPHAIRIRADDVIE